MPVFYCAIIPTARGPPHCVRGIAASSVADCVYTLAHAIGFVTRSLRAAPAFTAVLVRGRPQDSVIIGDRCFVS